MRYRLQRHDGTDCSATMVPFTVLRLVPIQRYCHIVIGETVEKQELRVGEALYQDLFITSSQ